MVFRQKAKLSHSEEPRMVFNVVKVDQEVKGGRLMDGYLKVKGKRSLLKCLCKVVSGIKSRILKYLFFLFFFIKEGWSG